MSNIAGFYEWVPDDMPPLKWYQRLAINLHLRASPPRYGHYERIPDDRVAAMGLESPA